MATRGRKPLNLRNNGNPVKLLKRNYYIEDRYTKALAVLSALTGKELSLLVNEAVGDLIHEYQPKTDIDLLEMRTLSAKD